MSQTTPVTDNGVVQTYAATPPAGIEPIPLNPTTPADFASFEEVTGPELVNTTSGADAVQETGLTARQRKIENYTNLLARAHSAEEISRLVMWDDDFFAQVVDDVHRNGFDSEFAVLSGFEMGWEDDPKNNPGHQK